jgi:hypothetical protein
MRIAVVTLESDAVEGADMTACDLRGNRVSLEDDEAVPPSVRSPAAKVRDKIAFDLRSVQRVARAVDIGTGR